MDLERLEIEALFNDLYQLYGYDFRNYYYESARRRVLQLIALNHLQSISNLRKEIISNSTLADDLIRQLSINVTEMFRDPDFFLELRQQVLTQLSQFEHIKIWHAGCATGEEVYSMAILLTEENIYNKSLLYATDFNNTVLDQAKSGIVSLSNMRNNIKNYQQAGGIKPFSDYY
ncbi:MAG: CheR family methyltransferase, partial [Pseudomonadota bacterium]